MDWPNWAAENGFNRDPSEAASKALRRICIAQAMVDR